MSAGSSPGERAEPHHRGMHTVELWRWRLTDLATGRAYRTRYVMTQEDAFALDPSVQLVEGSLERRQVPDGPHEHQHTNPSKR